MDKLNDFFRERPEVMEMIRANTPSVYQARMTVVLPKETREVDLGEGIEKCVNREVVVDQAERTPSSIIEGLDQAEACKD